MSAHRRRPAARFRSWLSARLAWLDTDDPTDGPSYASDDLCSCSPAAVGPRGSSCPRCGGGVVYLSQHPTDETRVLLEPGNYDVPPEVEQRYGREVLDEINRGDLFPPFLDDWNSPEDAAYDDADDLPSTVDPGVVTDPKEE